VKERPLIFTADSVRAILEGRKTQTRRVAKLLLPGDKNFIHAANSEEWATKRAEQCPYGVPGDRLWVREGYAMQCNVEDDEPPYSDGRPVKRWDDGEIGSGWLQPHYRATDPTPDLSCEHKRCEQTDNLCRNPWNSPLLMPRWASRITLETTALRVQRVQEISNEDAFAEGCDFRIAKTPNHANAFAILWDSINAKRGYSWESNPWVWALTFKRVESARATA
jgi:hypothetical protein